MTNGTGGKVQAPSSHEDKLAEEELHELQEHIEEMLDDKCATAMNKASVETFLDSKTDMQNLIDNVRDRGNIKEKQKSAERRKEIRSVLLRQNEDSSGKFSHLTADFEPHSTVVKDPRTGQYTANVIRMHEIFKEEWQKIMNHHSEKPPDFKEFLKAHPNVFDNIPRAGDLTPNALQMWQQAQRAKDRTVNGLDGWRPVELKTLPVEAWIPREQILALGKKLTKWPSSHYAVSSPVLSKRDKLDPKIEEAAPNPSNHRMLAVYVAIYRTVAGAWYRNHIR